MLKTWSLDCEYNHWNMIGHKGFDIFNEWIDELGAEWLGGGGIWLSSGK